MAPVGPSFFTVSDRPPASRAGSEIGPIVVWLWGEHDISTDRALGLALEGAIALDGAGLIVDLSAVEFMGASTLGVIARARELLRQRSASLTVRSPSAFARRVISLCGLNDLLAPSLEMAPDVTGERSAPGWYCRRPGGAIGAGAVSADRQVETAGRRWRPGGSAHREGKDQAAGLDSYRKTKDVLKQAGEKGQDACQT